MIFFFVAIIVWLFMDFNIGKFFHNRWKKEHFYEKKHSDIHFFMDGHTLFADYFQKIKEATHHIHILFYIVRNDKMSNQFFSLLEEKAKAGVEVRLLVDWIGSIFLSRKSIRRLKSHGVQFAYASKLKLPFLFYRLNVRNHRKITVIDGHTSYVGGFNVGKEYMGEDEKFGEWRDYHVRITGEGAVDLQRQFSFDWYEATKERLSDDYFKEMYKGRYEHCFQATDGAGLQNHYIGLIKRAKKELIIGSPYFIPGKKVMNALLQSAKSGVDIKIIVPKKPDHPFVKEASIPYLHRLSKSGCHIYEFQNGFYHAKVIVVDDILCDIGTANFDKRSLFLNKEMNCYIYDKQFIHEVKQKIALDLERCELWKWGFGRNRSIWQKSKEVFSTFISGLL